MMKEIKDVMLIFFLGIDKENKGCVSYYELTHMISASHNVKILSNICRNQKKKKPRQCLELFGKLNFYLVWFVHHSVVHKVSAWHKLKNDLTSWLQTLTVL